MNQVTKGWLSALQLQLVNERTKNARRARYDFAQMRHKQRSREIAGRKSAGFTILEIAIVIAVLGLLAAGFATMLTALLKSTKSRVAADNAAVVQQALQRFIERSGRLPCPAIPNAGTGIEDNPATSCSTTAVGTVGMARGVVPWTSLGLPLEQVQDGYARMFTYHVTIAATVTTLSAQPPLPVTSTNSIGAVPGNMTIHTGTAAVLGLPTVVGRNQINSCWTGAAAPPPDENSCNLRSVVVLLSHGENGLGAFTSQGGQLPAPTDAGEIENTDNNVAFVKGDPTATGFDDLVFAWSPDDLIEPLVRRGTVRSAVASAVELAKNTAVSIANSIVNSASCSPTPCTPSAVVPNTLTLGNDPWGRPLGYATTMGGANICVSPPAAGATAFTVTTTGLDKSPGLNSNTNLNDDFTITVTVDQMRSQIATRYGSCG